MTTKMKALMTLPKTATRGKVAPGEVFDASAQERLDYLQSGRAKDVSPAKSSKSAGDSAT